MGPAYFVISILGCGDGGVACRTVATPATPYASEQACLAARGNVLIENTDLEFPNLVAECLPVSRKASVPGERPPASGDSAAA